MEKTHEGVSVIRRMYRAYKIHEAIKQVDKAERQRAELELDRLVKGPYDEQGQADRIAQVQQKKK